MKGEERKIALCEAKKCERYVCKHSQKKGQPTTKKKNCFLKLDTTGRPLSKVLPSPNKGSRSSFLNCRNLGIFLSEIYLKYTD
jgi:hypothetical protein